MIYHNTYTRTLQPNNIQLSNSLIEIMNTTNTFNIENIDTNTSNIENIGMSFTKTTYNVELNCNEVIFGERTYLFDQDDFCKIIEKKNKFKLYSLNDIYPFYVYNLKNISYLEYLYFDGDILNYTFLNGNKYDLRKCNVILTHKKDAFVRENYDVIEFIRGHFPKYKHCNIMKNPLWRVNINGKERILMYCETDALCILCPESYQKVCEYENKECNGNKLTFHKGVNGYIMAHNTQTTYLSIHQIIMDCYGNGKGTKTVSVDHIDRNPLNNCMDNLRIATDEEQQQNKKGTLPNTKRERQYNARALPEGIEHNMLRKWVVYNKETYNKTKGLTRDYFRVEVPSLNVSWETTKSAKVSILDKLNEANRVAENIENGIMPTKPERILPIYFTIGNKSNKKSLIFDRRKNGKRCNMCYPINDDTQIDALIETMKKELILKYEDENIYKP